MNAISAFSPIRFGWSTANPPQEENYLHPQIPLKEKTSPKMLEPSKKLTFGWTVNFLKRNPSSYLFELGKDDFTWTTDKSPPQQLLGGWLKKLDKTLIPQDKTANKFNEKVIPRLKPELLQRMLEALTREPNRLDKASFVTVKGLEKQFKTPQSLEVFFRWLMADLAWVINNKPEYRAYYGLDPQQGDSLLVSGLKYLRDGEQSDFPKYTHKAPHFDNCAEIGGLLHLPVKNIKGGQPQVFDLLHYAADNPEDKHLTSKVTRDKRNPGDHEKEVIHPDLVNSQKFQLYSFTIPREPDKPLLVLFNNNGPGRIAHGATPMEILDEEAFQRRIIRYTLHHSSVVRVKDHPLWVEHYPPSEL